MSRPQRSFLIAALTLVAAALVWLGVGVLDEGRHTTPTVELDPGAIPVPGSAPPEQQATVLRASPPAPRTDAAPTPLATLEVRVIDPRGAPLPEAIIRATGAGHDNALEARGRALWTELEPGPWQLEVAHADYPTYRTRVVLGSDKPLRHIVQLDTQLALRGRVIDRFGRPRPALEIWFLRPGERHPRSSPPGAPPMVFEAVDAPLGTSSDRHGRFTIDLPVAGPWRVSLGPPGTVLAAMHEPRDLYHGGPDELEVVLHDTTRLEVVRTDGVTEGIYVRILRRKEQRSNELQDDTGALATNGLPAAPKTSRGPKRGALTRRISDSQQPRVGTDPSPWTTFAGRQLVAGRVIFDRLPAREELRFAVQRNLVLHESASSFSLLPDHSARIEFELQPLERDEDGDTLPLAIRFHSARLQDDELPAGFHWQE